ncbi:MAG: YqaJ viral recombinase family protein [candidate division Zixibacteria bacterium]|nr:YqaJ viral recombinase family protein [candidate division Zixibacteria bacterium]
METVNFKQGSAEWHAHRAKHLNASDAPVVMNLSSYRTRDELLREKKTGITKEVDAATQRVFDKGHEYESMARPFIEKYIDEMLSPITGTNIIEDLPLSASFDGIDFGMEVCFEHKTLNKKLAKVVTIDDLDVQYKVQMQQQMMVSGARKCIFVASKGVEEGMIKVWFEYDEELAKDIIAAWKQFEIDLDVYEPGEMAVQVAAEVVKDLPAVRVQVSGEISIIDNFSAFEDALRDFIDNRLVRSPQTDQDFADLDAQIKSLKKAEKALNDAETSMLSQVEEVDSMKRTKDMLYKIARDNRLVAEKLLKSEKDNRKNEILTGANNDFRDHLNSINESLGGKVMLPLIQADIAGAMKGRSSIDKIKEAVAGALADAKIEANRIADKVRLNLESLRADAKGYEFLFSDAQQLVIKENDDLKNLIAMRISDRKKAEEERLENERDRIRQEELDKIAEEKRKKEAARLQEVADNRRQAESPAAEQVEPVKAEPLAEQTAAAEPTQAEETSASAETGEQELINRPASMDEVIQKAAQHLPKGYVISIKIEHEGYDVELETPTGEIMSADGGDGIISDVNEALCEANGFTS